MRWWTKAWALLSLPLMAGPVDFGLDELQRAIASKGLKPGMVRVALEVSASVKPESFQIAPGRISGGDRRGLLYGLLEAAEQIRAKGRLLPVKKEPPAVIRGLRLAVGEKDFERSDFHTREFWRNHMQTLARSRINRLHLAFGAEPKFDSLRMIADVALDYAVDLTVGMWPHHSSTQTAMEQLLAECGGIRAVYLNAAKEPALAAMQQAGRLIFLEAPVEERLAEEATRQGILNRTLVRFTVSDLYAPPRSFHKPFVWALDAAGWPDPDFIRRVARSVAHSGAHGFEVEHPGFEQAYQTAFFAAAWGRLSYDPAAPDWAWRSVLEAPFGAAFPEVAAAFEAAGRAEHVFQRASAPDRFLASPKETVSNRLNGVASAKQTTIETMWELQQCVLRMERGLRTAPAVEEQLRGPLRLTQFRMRRLWASELFELSEATRHDTALQAARVNLRVALRLAEQAAPLQMEPIRADLALIEKWIEENSPQLPLRWPVPVSRPLIQHKPPAPVTAGKPLLLAVYLPQRPDLTTVRLHYKQSGGSSFRTIESSARPARFLIPAQDVAVPGRLHYYFEILHREGGWFEPDPGAGFPYYAVDVRPAPVSEALRKTP